MKKYNNDKRVRRTKKALKESLSELMMKKELRNITVQELVDHADVHRATFYAHYSDIYDLYEQIENEIVNGIGEIIARETSYSNSYDDLFKLLVDYVYDNSHIFAILLEKKQNYSFHDRVSSFLENKYLEFWQHETQMKLVPKEVMLFINYHIKGCLSILNYWASDNYSYSKEEIINCICQTKYSPQSNRKMAHCKISNS